MNKTLAYRFLKTWCELSEVTLDDDDCIDVDFTPSAIDLPYTKGTDRTEIWLDLEEKFGVSIGECMQGGLKNQLTKLLIKDYFTDWKASIDNDFRISTFTHDIFHTIDSKIEQACSDIASAIMRDFDISH